MRFLWLLAVVVALVWLVRRAMGSPPRRRPPPAGPDRPGREGAGLPHETMVACEVCRLHLPRDEAVWEADRAFCGEAHRVAFLKGGDSAL